MHTLYENNYKIWKEKKNLRFEITYINESETERNAMWSSLKAVFLYFIEFDLQHTTIHTHTQVPS